jgi:hypothetical protein
MKWYAIEWFGGIKVECEECGLHAAEWKERESRAVMRAHRSDYHVPHCVTCAHECSNMDKDIPDLSLRKQIAILERENDKLKKQIDPWKDAWFHLREIIGWLWWHHPAIDSDEQRAYYQTNLNRIRECQKEQTK